MNAELRHKIALQVVKSKIPGYKKTKGEWSEDARFIENGAYVNNIMNLIQQEIAKARIGLLDYFDQVPNNEVMDWKGLFADVRKQLEAEQTLKDKETK